MKRLVMIAVITLSIVAAAGSLSAQTALKDVPQIRDGIIDVGMAYELSEKCGSVSARLFRGIGFLQSLRNEAAQLGYSEAEIDAYINDKAEKRRLEAIARAQLASLGVVEGEEATYCAVARSQMAANTRVGWLLR